MAVEIKQGEVFAACPQRCVRIKPLTKHLHDPLVAPIQFTEPVPALQDGCLCRPDHSSTFPTRSNCPRPMFFRLTFHQGTRRANWIPTGWGLGRRLYRSGPLSLRIVEPFLIA